MARVLLCSHCGGPLPRPESDARFLTCRFCEATTDLETGAPHTDAAKAVARIEHVRTQMNAFEQAFRERIDQGEPAILAFRAAAEDKLVDVADADALANVTFGLASDFFTQTSVDVTRDPIVMYRIADGYLTSLQKLALDEKCTINLPFLTATAQGPLHFMQDVTKERLRELAATPAALPGKPKPPPPASAPERVMADPPKKSFWKKIFG